MAVLRSYGYPSRFLIFRPLAGVRLTERPKHATPIEIIRQTVDGLAGNFAAQAKREGGDAEAICQARIAKHPAKRLGRPDEFGGTCAFLCSAHAGYINGQTVLMDRGRFRERFSYRVIACCDVSSCRHVH